MKPVTYLFIALLIAAMCALFYFIGKGNKKVEYIPIDPMQVKIDSLTKENTRLDTVFIKEISFVHDVIPRIHAENKAHIISLSPDSGLILLSKNLSDSNGYTGGHGDSDLPPSGRHY